MFVRSLLRVLREVPQHQFTVHSTGREAGLKLHGRGPLLWAGGEVHHAGPAAIFSSGSFSRTKANKVSNRWAAKVYSLEHLTSTV